MAKLVGKRYATALFDLAVSENALDKYEAEVSAVLVALKDESDFMAVLNDRKITLEEKIALIEKVFTDKVMSPIVGLLVLLIKKGRQNDIIEVLEVFIEMVKANSGIIKAVVTSAVPLKPEQLEAIKAKIEAGINGKVELENIIDANIIAGLVIRVGDKVVDASVQGEMQTMKKQLSQLRLA